MATNKQVPNAGNKEEEEEDEEEEEVTINNSIYSVTLPFNNLKETP